jgi:AAA family ATP:ADP antiporter
MSGATAAVLIFAVPLYSRFTRNAARNQLIISVTLFFASHLLAFYAVGRLLGLSLWFALAFYLWIAVFNMMIVAQFWAFANDLYREEAGKRLFPLLGLGASLGAVAGSGAAAALIPHVGPLNMMPIAVLVLVASAAIVQRVHEMEIRQAPSELERAAARSAIGGSFSDGFGVVFAQRYLLLIAAFSLVFTLVKSNGDYVLSQIVSTAAAERVRVGAVGAGGLAGYIGSFFAGYQFWIDMISLAIQALVVSRLLRHVGVNGAFYVLPLIALGDAVGMLVFPILAAVRIGKTAESAVDYSLNNTLRNILWLRTSRRAKYLGKQAVDTFFVRMGDVASAAVVFVGIHAFSASVRGFAATNVVLVGVWLMLARLILKERDRLSPTVR